MQNLRFVPITRQRTHPCDPREIVGIHSAIDAVAANTRIDIRIPRQHNARCTGLRLDIDGATDARIGEQHQLAVRRAADKVDISIFVPVDGRNRQSVRKPLERSAPDLVLQDIPDRLAILYPLVEPDAPLGVADKQIGNAIPINVSHRPARRIDGGRIKRKVVEGTGLRRHQLLAPALLPGGLDELWVASRAAIQKHLNRPGVRLHDEIEPPVAIQIDDCGRDRTIKGDARPVIPAPVRGEELLIATIDERSDNLLERLEIRFQEFSVRIPNRTFDRIIRHQRVRPVRQFLGKCEAVAIRVAVHRHVRGAIPVELAAPRLIRLDHGHDFDGIRRHRECGDIQSPSPGVALGDAIHHPIREFGRGCAIRSDELACQPASRPHIVVRRREESPLRIRTERIRMSVPGIILQQFTIGEPNRPLDIRIRHERIRSARQFLGKGRAITIRVAVHRHVHRTIPIEFLPSRLIRLDHGHDLHCIRRHVERDDIDRAPPGIPLDLAVHGPVGEICARRAIRPKIGACEVGPRRDNVPLRREQRPFRLAPEDVRRIAVGIVLEQFAIPIPHRPLDIGIRHQRVRSVRQFLGKGEAIAVRVGRAVLHQISIPVEFVAVRDAIAIRILRRRHVMRRQRRVFIQLESRHVQSPSPRIASHKLLCRRN